MSPVSGAKVLGPSGVTPGSLLLKALAVWPDYSAEHVFLARLNSGVLDAQALGSFVPEDFYLACAAMKQNPQAVAHVTELLERQTRFLGHLKLAPAEVDDIFAALASELFIAPEGGRPRLERYSGTGPLAGWLQVVLTRDALKWLRSHKREVPADDETLLGQMESPAESPELGLLKSRYSGQMSASFRRAIAALEPRQRNLLRQHYLDELTLADLAALYRVHRATVARWLADAKVALLEKTRDDLCVSAGLERQSAESVMRLVQSRLDLSAGVFLSAVQK
jgi:RNA polymerase sigma-70 factor (ECF subfamily)